MAFFFGEEAIEVTVATKAIISRNEVEEELVSKRTVNKYVR